MFTPSRRQLLGLLAAAPAFAQRKPQRLVVLMFDGFGYDYFEQSNMPNLKRWAKSGILRRVASGMPSATNTNNASICCGVWPSEHGITGNSYLNEATGREEYMETADLLLAPTLFERAAKQGVKSGLLSSKKKTTTLLPKGADIVMTPENPPQEWVAKLGPAPPIYSREINYWLLRAAIDLLKTRRDLGVLYVHTTDYAMHTWGPETAESKEHLARLDALLGEAAAAAPDAAFLLTADHSMNHKSVCVDLEKACAKRGAPITIALSVDRDRYVKHHRGYGGVSWIYCKDVDRVAAALASVKGVESVLTRAEASRRFHLMPSLIGDLCVLGDVDTVFGDLDAETEQMPTTYRAHGSLHEVDVPLIVHNCEAKLVPGDFRFNHDLVRWAFR